ncbi:MAG: hypothetical protein ABDI20_07655 [Candidatus Bipolaricaulaceae bacterium]
MLLTTTLGNPEREELCLRLLQERRVDGILFVTPWGNEHLIREIHAEGFPVVVLDRKIRGIQASQERLRAYRDALHACGIRVSQRWVEVGWFFPEEATKP